MPAYGCWGPSGTLATKPRQRKRHSGVWAGPGSAPESNPAWPVVNDSEPRSTATPPQTCARTCKLKVMAASKAISRFKYPERTALINLSMPQPPPRFQPEQRERHRRRRLGGFRFTGAEVGAGACLIAPAVLRSTGSAHVAFGAVCGRFLLLTIQRSGIMLAPVDLL